MLKACTCPSSARSGSNDQASRAGTTPYDLPWSAILAVPKLEHTKKYPESRASVSVADYSKWGQALPDLLREQRFAVIAHFRGIEHDVMSGPDGMRAKTPSYDPDLDRQMAAIIYYTTDVTIRTNVLKPFIVKDKWQGSLFNNAIFNYVHQFCK